MSRLVEAALVAAPAAAMLIWKILPLLHLGAHAVGAPHVH